MAKTLNERIVRCYRILRKHSERWHPTENQHDLNVGAIAYWWKLDIAVIENALSEAEQF